MTSACADSTATGSFSSVSACSGVFDTSRLATHASPLGESTVLNIANGAGRLGNGLRPRRYRPAAGPRPPGRPTQPVYVAPPTGPITAPPVVGAQTVHGYSSPSAGSPPSPSATTPGMLPAAAVVPHAPPQAAPLSPSGTAAGVGLPLMGPPAMPAPAPMPYGGGVPGAADGPPAMPPPLSSASAPAAAPAPTAAPAPAPSTASTSAEPSAPLVPASSAASGRTARSSSQLGPGASSAWFDEGERASEEADNVRARKIISPSAADMSLYDDGPPPRRRWPLVAAILGGLVLVGGIAFALTRGGDDKPAAKPEPTVAQAPEPPAIPPDVPPSQIITPDGSGSAATPAPPATTVPATTPPARSPGKASSTPTTPTTPTTKRPTSTTRVDPDDTAGRRPNLDWFGNGSGGTATPTTPTTTTPPTTTTTTPPTKPNNGVSGADGPVDPYGGGGDTPPSDEASPDKKAEFFANLGKQQLAQGDAAGAAASFKKALELDGKNVPAVIGMGEIALRQGLFGDAIAHLKKASRLAPKSSYVFTLLGEAYLGTGNNSLAADAFKRALQLDPDNTRARDGFNDAQSQVPPAEDDAP